MAEYQNNKKQQVRLLRGDNIEYPCLLPTDSSGQKSVNYSKIAAFLY
jgi:hypothetical protein